MRCRVYTQRGVIRPLSSLKKNSIFSRQGAPCHTRKCEKKRRRRGEARRVVRAGPRAPLAQVRTSRSRIGYSAVRRAFLFTQSSSSSSSSSTLVTKGFSLKRCFWGSGFCGGTATRDLGVVPRCGGSTLLVESRSGDSSDVRIPTRIRGPSAGIGTLVAVPSSGLKRHPRSETPRGGTDRRYAGGGGDRGWRSGRSE
jgi:hypothetical protein